MTKIPLAELKAHLSEVIDDVQFKEKSIVILRHGKPSAKIVPIRAPKKRLQIKLAAKQIESILLGWSGTGTSAVNDLLKNRR